MDVDESNDGHVIGRVTNSIASDNFEEGWDFNENDAGDFLVDLTNVEASRNLEEVVAFEEDDDFPGGGDLVTTLVGVTADENEGGDAGIKIREKSVGKLGAAVRGARADGNDEDGINVREDDAGDLLASVDESTRARTATTGSTSTRTATETCRRRLRTARRRRTRTTVSSATKAATGPGRSTFSS